MVAALLFLAAANRALIATPHKPGSSVTAGALLAACVLSHPLVGIPAGFALLTLTRKDNIKKVVTIGSLGVGLSAWWWVPAVGHIWITASRHIDKLDAGQVFRWEILVCVPFAAWGMWRLSQRVPDRRVLMPLVFLTVGMVLHWVFIVDGNDFHSGGRSLVFWVLLVPAFAVWGVIDWVITQVEPKHAVALTAMVATLLVLGYPMLLETHRGDGGWVTNGLNRDAVTVDNENPSPDCDEPLGHYRGEPPMTFLHAIWGTVQRFGDNCLLSTVMGTSTPVLGGQHRNVAGLTVEGSPTYSFLEETVRNASDGKYSPPHAPKRVSPPSWDRAAAQMMTLGVDEYWVYSNWMTTSEYSNAAFETISLDSAHITAFRVPVPPSTWPSLWRETNRGEWLQWSMEQFAAWDDTHAVVVPVWGTTPSGLPANPELITTKVDWSNDHQVVFRAPFEGFYYLPVSYHPNWDTTENLLGPWRAGPNQMVVYAPEAGKQKLVFERSRWETTGLGITSATLAVIAGWLLRQRIRFPQSNTPRNASPVQEST